MQGLELLIISAGILVAVAYVATQTRRRGATDHVIARLLLGLVPAAIAVALIVINRLDVIPDDIEQSVFVVAIVLVSLALILGTSYRLARH